MRKRTHQRGFTLLELMVVLAIMGILASIAAPSFNGLMDARKLSAAVEAIYSDVRYARSESIKCSQDTSITFADTAVAPATVWSSWQYSFPQCDGTVKTVTSTQFSVATVISIPATYTFNFVRGTANGGTITITADDGSSGTVTVSPIGRITSSY